MMKTCVVLFPFDLFGGGGSAAGAQLLADALREMMADNDNEKLPTRARAYQDAVYLKEFSFDKLAAYEDWRAKAGRAIRQVWRKSEWLLWIAGNHLGALPLYDELSEDRDGTLVIQFDAHLDVYNLSDCTSELSHGNFLRHCKGPLPAIVNLGHRDLFLRPDYVERYYQRTFSASDLAIDPVPALDYVSNACRAAKRVFIDFDCDVFDPAFFPAISHALPFGLPPTTVLRLLNSVLSDNVVGLAVSEFEPARDINDRSLATLVWLVEYLLLRRYERQKSASNPTRTS
jgi:agmatinase